jgi:DNA-binding HxlR family transcriptional regulator
VAGYGQFCAMAKAAEIVAERWTPLVMREILMGSTRFSELERGVPRMSKSMLVTRLRSLEEAGLIERRQSEQGHGWEYLPTDAGRDLYNVLELLGTWGARWVTRDIGEADIEPDLLIWDMHRRIALDRLPEQRTVIQIDTTGAYTRNYWLVMEGRRRDVSVCYHDPGFEVDLLVTADTLTLHRVWVGHVSLAEAERSGMLRLDGPRDLVQQFPEWLQLSIFAHVKPVR